MIQNLACTIASWFNDGGAEFFIFSLVPMRRLETRERMSMLVGHVGHAMRRVCKIQFNSMETLTMDIQLETLEAEALKLTSGERAAFAQLLLASLDEDAEIEDAWAGEVERRINEIESGAVQVVPISEALAHVRAALK
jgi:putative addiction module component (TIGR02574 family)